MRGRLAAACAAVLVGLSPAGALPLASFAATVCTRGEAAQHGARTRREGERAHERAVPPAAASAPASFVRESPLFRTPSGPAPSQAPPAAA